MTDEPPDDTAKTISGDGSPRRETAEGVATGTVSEEEPTRQLACDPPEALPAVAACLRKVIRVRGRPLFILAAHYIDDDVCAEVYSWRSELKNAGSDDQLDVLIHSPGGSLTDCYRTARLFARYTNDWQALVPAVASSGATLICLGSSEIIQSDIGQLGPIDPQVISKRHEKFFEFERQSPLEAFQAVKYLREFALTSLDSSMIFLLEHGVTPHLALEAANKFATELTRPVLAQVEPYDLGSFALDSKLATDYCRRICDPADPKKKTQRAADYRALVENYPAHEFIIDAAEARSLGLNVREPSEELSEAFDEVNRCLRSAHLCVGLVLEHLEGAA